MMTASRSPARTNRALRRNRQRRRRSLICRATRNRFRRAISNSTTARTISRNINLMCSRFKATIMPAILAAITPRRMSGLTGLHHRRRRAAAVCYPQRQSGRRANGHDKATVRIALDIAAAGVIARAATSARTVRIISAMSAARRGAIRASDGGDEPPRQPD